MNGYQRFMTALRREQPDRVPVWELIINRPVIEALHGDISYLEFCEREDLDGVCMFDNNRHQALDAAGTVRDEWGIVWGVGGGGIYYPEQGPVESEADLDRLVPPDPDADYRLRDLEAAVARFKGERAIVFLTHDGFEFPAYLRGMDNLLTDYVLNPEWAHRLARMVVDYKRAVMLRAIEVGADVIVSGDDYAYRHAPLMSPRHFREFVLPYLTELVGAAHQAGVPFIKHTDGNLWPILDLLVESGIDALDPLEPLAGMDIGEVKQRWGDRLALCGNVDCSALLPRGTPRQVEEAVQETIAKAAVGGGHILASSNSIHPAVKPENYRAMLRAARRWGVYPLDERMVAEYREKRYIEQYLGEAG